MHAMRQMPATAILAMAVLALGALPVAADCQMAGPIEDEVATAEVVFVGIAAEVIGSMARFEVSETWAGPIGGSVEVHGLTSGVEFSEDDRQWEAGTTYLVVPHIEGQVLRDSICSATIEWTDELAALRPADAIVHAGASAPAEAGLPPLAIAVGLVLVAAVSVSAVLFLRGERAGQ